jgi:hypothetical protein
MGIWFDNKLDRMLSKIVRKHNVALDKKNKPNGKQLDMFKTEEYHNRPEDRYHSLRRNDGGPSK